MRDWAGAGVPWLLTACQTNELKLSYLRSSSTTFFPTLKRGEQVSVFKRSSSNYLANIGRRTGWASSYSKQKTPETVVSLGAKLADLTSKVDKSVDLTTANNILLNTVVKRVEDLEIKVETNAGALHDNKIKVNFQEKRISSLETKRSWSISWKIAIAKKIWGS